MLKFQEPTNQPCTNYHLLRIFLWEAFLKSPHLRSLHEFHAMRKPYCKIFWCIWILTCYCIQFDPKKGQSGHSKKYDYMQNPNTWFPIYCACIHFCMFFAFLSSEKMYGNSSQIFWIVAWRFFFVMQNVEMRGIDPRTSRMLSERSTIWATSPYSLV